MKKNPNVIEKIVGRVVVTVKPDLTIEKRYVVTNPATGQLQLLEPDVVLAAVEGMQGRDPETVESFAVSEHANGDLVMRLSFKDEPKPDRPKRFWVGYFTGAYCFFVAGVQIQSAIDQGKAGKTGLLAWSLSMLVVNLACGVACLWVQAKADDVRLKVAVRRVSSKP